MSSDALNTVRSCWREKREEERIGAEWKEYWRLRARKLLRAKDQRRQAAPKD
jgi:hypothetical protein